jgi:probable phosphoglycerate mutase
MRLYFVRHGESEANVLNVFSNSPFRHGLTQKGKQQAIALAATLRDAPVSLIYSSPILRAVQTAEILAQALGVPLRIVDALREYDVGVLEGQSDAASWQMYWDVIDAWLRRHEWDKRIDQGESFHDIRQRFLPFIETLIQEHRSLSGGIVLVGHGGTYRCMLPLILDNVDFQFAIDHLMSNTAAVVAEARPDGVTCLAWGDTLMTDQEDGC